MRTIVNHRLTALLFSGALLAAIAPLSPDPTPSTAPPAPLPPAPSTRACREEPFNQARIYWEYNATDNDLGVHVLLDAEDWKRVRIESPDERVLFDVRGRGPYQLLGMTELFFEGAEPSLNEVRLERLLAMFPEGEYCFEGVTVDEHELESEAMFSHAIPAGPNVSATVGGNNHVQIRWTAVTTTPPGFPIRRIQITGYQVVVGSFQVTLPATARSVTLPAEFVAALAPGEHEFEVLAIDRSGNQTLSAGHFRR
jgi:hypothetical protein